MPNSIKVIDLSFFFSLLLNALSLRLVIDPLCLMFLAMLLDGGVNAG